MFRFLLRLGLKHDLTFLKHGLKKGKTRQNTRITTTTWERGKHGMHPFRSIQAGRPRAEVDGDDSPLSSASVLLYHYLINLSFYDL
jgi:hypothetical protein